ncbi:MAG TPA: alanine--glyoxylate aminotransferase family protein [Thermomicrobiales bacterium]|nr:alanine--glyoxylate aminotransferase family protein [Thermomicrobiales bacterium]
MDSRLDQGRWLRIPGPTPLHPDVVAALTHEMVALRGPEVQGAMARIQEAAKKYHGTTEGRVLLWAATGTAGFEASIVNLLAPGDHVVVTTAGAFGERFADTADAFGLNVKRVDVEWGEAVTPDLLKQAIDEHGDVKAVMITHNETSTGVTQDLKTLGRVANDAGALVIVDAVSSAGALPIDMDENGLDWVLSGAQKAWMCPPGLMISALSPRALDVASKQTGFPRVIWDVPTMAAASEHNFHPTTGPMTHIFAFDAALQAMEAEGLEAVFERHRKLGQYFRDGMERIGFEILAKPEVRSDTVTTFYPPEGVSASAFQAKLRDASGIEIATGQGAITDKVNRIGHMGWVAQPELDATLEALEAARQE